MRGHRGQWEWRILGLALGSSPIADDEMKAPRCKLRRSAHEQGMEDGETQGAWTHGCYGFWQKPGLKRDSQGSPRMCERELES